MVHWTHFSLLFLSAVFADEIIKQTNILLIMFDDLRPELSVYGREHMITPNFERLAKRSVVFDKAYSQISVCNPSRDSLMTGLRPDTVGTYGFQSSFRPHLVLPTQMVRSGYNTAGFGKLVHWETDDPGVWSFDRWENNWYEYQNIETNFMNSSTMPDKVWPEERFRDHEFTTRAISTFRRMLNEPNFWMLGLGFKLPHLAVHLPHKYFAMYKNKTASWRLSKKELRFPPSAPEVSYRCCANPDFRYMNEEGAKPSHKAIHLGDINFHFTEEMHDELMMGYCGAITFVDKQLGRLLDVMDEFNLWENTTVVLTADHGMLNGEKGIWEKWSMFDEASRVPLFIAHPQSPYKGQHFTEPVELLDVYPTINDLANAPYDKKKICIDKTVCHPLQGKSLAKIVLGTEQWQRIEKGRSGGSKKKKGGKRRLHDEESVDEDALISTNPDEFTNETLFLGNFSLPVTAEDARMLTAVQAAEIGPAPLLASNVNSVKLDMSFALTQSWRCAKKDLVMESKNNPAVRTTRGHRMGNMWVDGDKTKNPPDEICVMGYSMRTSDFRYTAWFHYNRHLCVPIMDVAPFDEELYDHRGETLADFTHQELVNLVKKAGFESIILNYREKIINFVRSKIIFRGCFKD